MTLTNKHNVHPAIEKVLSASDYDFDPNLNNTRISATTLYNPPMIRQLKLRNHDKISEDVSTMLWSVLGSAVHTFLERFVEPNWIREKRIEHKCGEGSVSGKVDLYDIKDKSIQDFKCTRLTAVFKEVKDGDRSRFIPVVKPDWEKQLNIYAWLYRKEGYPVEKLMIHAILRDWIQYKAKFDREYPQSGFVTIPIKLWPQEKTQSYIEERMALHLEANTQSIEDVQGCSSEERWSKGDAFKIYKGNGKRAINVYKDLDSCLRKLGNMKEAYPGSKYNMRKIKGGDVRCEDYCSVNKFCAYYQSKKQGVKL